MKVSKQIFFRLVFLTALLVCSGLEVYTCINAPLCNTEISSEPNCDENNVLSSADSSEDDHINQVEPPFYLFEQKIVLPVTNDEFSPIEFSCPSWQPPKFV